MSELWVESYRPSKIDDYVFRDDQQKLQIEQWIQRKSIPHLLLSGGPGIGKTTLALVLFKELGVDQADILIMNASDDNGVDAIREKIKNFASIRPFGDYRYILLDESDYLTPNAQAILRSTMETYSSTCRFILTCNYPDKIIAPLKSRCQGFHLETLDKEQFMVRSAKILLSEGVDFDPDVLDIYIKKSYPDLRKCIQGLEQNSLTGKLLLPNENDGNKNDDYKIEMIGLFTQKKINEARKLICSQARPEEVVDIFRFLYDNIEIWGDEAKQDEALLIIRNGLYRHALVADWEINLSATIVELKQLLG